MSLTWVSTHVSYQDTIAQIKRSFVDRACVDGSLASRIAAQRMLEDGSMTILCYGLTKINYRYQVDLAMEAYTRDRGKSKNQKRKAPSDGAPIGNKKHKQRAP